MIADYTPYMRLWCSVVLQAIADIDIQGKQKYLIAKEQAKKKGDKTLRGTPRKPTKGDIMLINTNEAEQWIDSEDIGVGTFRWICDMCDLDRHRIRKMSQTMQGRKELLQASAKRVQNRGLIEEQSNV